MLIGRDRIGHDRPEATSRPALRLQPRRHGDPESMPTARPSNLASPTSSTTCCPRARRHRRRWNHRRVAHPDRRRDGPARQRRGGPGRGPSSGEIAGVGTYDTAATIHRAREAEAAGADALLLVCPTTPTNPGRGVSSLHGGGRRHRAARGLSTTSPHAPASPCWSPRWPATAAHPRIRGRSGRQGRPVRSDVRHGPYVACLLLRDRRTQPALPRQRRHRSGQRRRQRRRRPQRRADTGRPMR